MQGSDSKGRAPRAIDYRILMVEAGDVPTGKRAPSHISLDNRAITFESKGPRQVHKMRARFGRRWRFRGVDVPVETLAKVRADLYGYSNQRFGSKIERVIIEHAMTQQEARMVLMGLRAWGTTTRKVAESDANVLVYDKDTQANIHDATDEAREHQRQRAKVQAIFDAARTTQLDSEGNIVLQVWKRTDGHVRHCACHGCQRLDKAIRAVGNFIRG
jgi:hypothetical protein